MILTIQIHETASGWLNAAEIRFYDNGRVRIEYDLDFASKYFGRKDLYALSVSFPVQLNPYDGEIPCFLTDLVPQGNALRRLMQRHQIRSESNYQDILAKVALASPGNIRIKETWDQIEGERSSYRHQGFTKAEIVTARFDFLMYMEQHGAPVGGTSGAAGGAPKFLLREDHHGYFHADGYLDDRLTKKAWLIKFPFTDSENSKILIRTEKAYYDVLRQLPLHTAAPIDITGDILFVERFDRTPRRQHVLHYSGLESFYSAQNISAFGASLNHEDNITLICQHSTRASFDVGEYLKRDLVNRALANIDNHGRNTSFIKEDGEVFLSPLYDVTAMRFFEGDFIVPLTRWRPEHDSLQPRLDWVSKTTGISTTKLRNDLRKLRDHLKDLPKLLKKFSVPPSIIEKSAMDREQVMQELHKI